MTNFPQKARNVIISLKMQCDYTGNAFNVNRVMGKINEFGMDSYKLHTCVLQDCFSHW